MKEKIIELTEGKDGVFRPSRVITESLSKKPLIMDKKIIIENRKSSSKNKLNDFLDGLGTGIEYINVIKNIMRGVKLK